MLIRFSASVFSALLPVLLPGLFLTGCVASAPSPVAVQNVAPQPAMEIPFRVLLPDGRSPASGRYPAVVIMHDCSGLGAKSSGAPARWANELLKRGYVVMIPDSFSTRGHAEGVCANPSPARFAVGPRRRAQDAFAALAYIRALPFVDGSRVGLMGGSQGGSTTLVTMASPLNGSETPAQGGGNGFAAAIALYPGCKVRAGSWRADATGVYQPTAPLYILIGEKDDWTPALPCRTLAQSAPAQGSPVTIKVYPGAHHAFDSRSPLRYVEGRMNANAPGGRGATTGGDPDAWADSILEVEAFFARHLLQKNP